jgi:RNase P/RNase MRP subunit POP5
MVKAGALRKRYILFELRGAEMPLPAGSEHARPARAGDLDEEALKRSLYAEALKFFGELGLSHAALKLVQYDKAKRQGILRCERGHLEDVLGFLALLDSLEGISARIVSLKASGTIKSLAD